jgi:hypothetical protein
MMIACFLGKTPRVIRKTVWHLLSFKEGSVRKWGENDELLTFIYNYQLAVVLCEQ